MPAGDYEIAVFDNRFPSLALDGRTIRRHLTVPTAPANGQCEVVVFTQDPQASLGRLPLSRIELLLQVWGDRSTRWGSTTSSTCCRSRTAAPRSA
jgi:UDPglucose--hexose-1-phosphate uridylyltransferase